METALFFQNNQYQLDKFCFPITDFFEGNESFDPKDFIKNYRTRVDSLQTLKQELENFLDIVKEETVSLIDHDFDQFIHFSSQLQKMAPQMNQLKTLQDCKWIEQQVKQQLESLEKYLKQCEQVLEEKQQILFFKSRAQEWIQVFQLLQNLEQSSDENPFIESLKWEAMEFYRCKQMIQCFTTALSSTPNISAIPRELSEYKESCVFKYSELEIRFFEKLQKLVVEHGVQSPELLFQICFAYSILNAQEKLERIIAESVFRPCIEGELSTLTPTIFYNALLNQIDAWKEVYFSSKLVKLGFKMLENALWPILLEFLLENQTWKLFEYRSRRVFHENYSQTMHMIKECVSKCCNTKEQAQTFMNTQVTPHLERKWQLKIYFTLVKQDSVKEFEHFLSQNEKNWKLNSNSDTPHQYHYSIFANVSNFVLALFNEQQVFLQKLGHEFITLMIQSLARFSHWLQEVVDKLLQMVQNKKIDLFSKPTSNHDQSYVDIFILLKDLYHLHEFLIQGKFIETCSQALKMDSTTTLYKQLQATLQNTFERLFRKPLIFQIQGCLVQNTVLVMIERIREELKKIASLTYTMKQQQQETSQVSPYVPTVLSILEILQSKVEPIVFEQSKTIILQQVAHQFSKISEETIKTLKKTEESLKKLGKYNTSSSEQVQSQLKLDLDTMVQMAQTKFKIENIN